MTSASDTPRQASLETSSEILEELRTLRSRVRQLEQARANWQWAEEALREDRLRLRAATIDAPLVVWKLDADGVFVHAEGRAFERIGLTPELVVGKSLHDFAAEAPDIVTIIERALAGEPVMTTVEFRGRKFEMCLDPLFDPTDAQRVTGVLAVSRDITNHVDLAGCVRRILEATSADVGEGFFRSLVQHVTKELRVKGAVMCRLVGPDRARLAALAMWVGEGLVDDGSRPIPVSKTPCGQVIEQGTLHIPSGAQVAFPEDTWLIDWGLDSYLGVPLIDSQGKAIGSLAVLDAVPITDRHLIEPVLRLLARRAAAELERQKADEESRHARRRLRRQNRALIQLSKLEAIGQGHLLEAIRTITEVAADIIDTERVNVWFFNEDHSRIRCIDQFEKSTGAHSEGYDLAADDYPEYFRAIRECRIISAPDACRDPRTRDFTETYLRPNGIGSLLDAPIRVAGKMVGIVCHEHVGPPREWTAEEEHFAASIADYVALAIEAHERKRAEDALRRARDELEQRVVERTARLTETNRRLRKEIDERRKTEAALRRSEARFRRLFESNIIGAFFATTAGQVVDANDAFLKLLGLERADLPLDWRAVIAREPTDVASLLFSSDASTPHEQELIAKDGQRVPVYLGSARLDDDPNVCVAFVVDLTERKQAERALAQSEERLRSMVSTAPDFILVLDNDDRIRFINRTNPGVPREHILGATPYELAEPEYHERVREALEHVRATGEYTSFDVLSRGLRGVPTWYTIRMGPFLQDNKIAGVTVIASDITDRKQIEEALRESESQFRQLANTVAAAAFIYQDDRLVYVNRAASQISGYSQQELLDMRLEELVDPDHRELVDTRVLAHRGQQAPTLHCEVKLRRKDGQARWVDFVSAPIDYRRRPALLGTAFDITDRKLAERELLDKQEFLKGLLEAHERDRQLTAYEIHDGLVQDVTAAKMHFEAFRRQQIALSHQGARDFDRGLELLTDTIHEARRLISGLRPPIIDERGIVEAIDYLINERSATDGVAIDFVHDVQFGRLDPVIEGAVFRIVQEALTNVYRHSQAQRARVSLCQRGDCLEIEVRDWGVGFRETDIPKDRFGLRGIRERARVLRGTAQIESLPGQGTRVAVQLPLPASEPNGTDRSNP